MGGEDKSPSKATFDALDICFCFCNEADMDIVSLKCCKQFIHRECLMTYLKFQSSCCYCPILIENINKICSYLAIDCSKHLHTAPKMTPNKISQQKKPNIQQFQIDDVFGLATPVHLADKMYTILKRRRKFFTLTRQRE